MNLLQFAISYNPPSQTPSCKRGMVYLLMEELNRNRKMELIKDNHYVGNSVQIRSYPCK